MIGSTSFLCVRFRIFCHNRYETTRFINYRISGLLPLFPFSFPVQNFSFFSLLFVPIIDSMPPLPSTFFIYFFYYCSNFFIILVV
eukprot:UN28016